MRYLIFNMLVALTLLATSNALFAQDEGEYTAEELEVVLPETAQSCVLPAAPDAIPEGAGRDQLLEAKKAVGDFQVAVTEYRDCLSLAEAGDITPGNKQAIVASYNYSVEMEERVAERFNEAVRAYKERQAEG